LVEITELIELEQLIRDTPASVIGDRVKDARLDYPGGKISLDRLGLLMGVPRQTLIGYEKAKHKPRAPMLLKLAEATGRDVRFFVNDAPFREAA
jgi:transcriptional regulator with XRE-family HTH domain